MPGAGGQDNTPRFRAGEAVSASKLNQLGDSVRRQRLAPGSFSSGGLDLQRKIGGGSGGGGGAVRLAVITGTAGLAAASGWDLASAGQGTGYYVDDDGILISPQIAIMNRYFNLVARYTPVHVQEIDSTTAVLVAAGCTIGPTISP